MKKILGIVVLGLLLSGCAEDTMNANLYNYDKIAPTINLGDDKNRTLSILVPLIQDLPANWKRPAEQFMKGDDRYYIYYHRTGWTSDNRLTDDELTPYIFKNDKLVSIGWQALGGAKTTGTATTYNNSNSDALISQGLEMLKTPTPSMPTTQTCRVTGTGAYKTVTCY